MLRLFEPSAADETRLTVVQLQESKGRAALNIQGPWVYHIIRGNVIYNGSVVFNLNGESFYVVNVYDSTGFQAGNAQRYDYATGNMMPQEYVSAGFQPVALAIVK